MSKRSVTATRDDQVDAVEDAFELVEEDIDAGRIEVDRWGESVPDGEKLRVLAEAYAGQLDLQPDGGDSGA